MLKAGPNHHTDLNTLQRGRSTTARANLSSCSMSWAKANQTLKMLEHGLSVHELLHTKWAPRKSPLSSLLSTRMIEHWKMYFNSKALQSVGACMDVLAPEQWFCGTECKPAPALAWRRWLRKAAILQVSLGTTNLDSHLQWVCKMVGRRMQLLPYPGCSESTPPHPIPPLGILADDPLLYVYESAHNNNNKKKKIENAESQQQQLTIYPQREAENGLLFRFRVPGPYSHHQKQIQSNFPPADAAHW